MDIHEYIHVWISDLGHAVDAFTDVWYQCLISDTGIRINDFTICVCIGDADILLLLRMFYAFLFVLCSSYSSFPPNSRSLLLSKMSAIIETLMQCAEWSQFAVDYFRMSLIWSKSTKLQLLEITSKHCSEAVCTLLLRVAGTITDVACTSEQGIVNTLTSRHLPAPQC